MPGQPAKTEVPKRPVSRRIEANRTRIEEELGFGISFDVVIKELKVAGKDAFLLAIDGFINTLVMTNVTHFLLRTRPEEIGPLTAEKLDIRRIGYIETEREGDLDKVVERVLSGFIALFVDGEDEAILIEARTYPGRQPEEPELEKVLRGPRDGFTETLIFNTALVRRRLRDPNLRTEVLPVGRRSRTDVAMVYIRDVANERFVSEIRDLIKRIKVDGLPMAEKALEEFLTGRKKWWNPFPVVRYTERPDIAATHLLEGHVVLMVDTSPVAMILPVTFFHHVQHAEEFHQDVTVGIFFRLVRYLALLIAWIGTPVWVALALSHDILPQSLELIGPKDPGRVPLFLQFILGELGVELIRMALIHTPTGLSTSLGIIGAILLGELATKVGLFSSEAVLYVALSALGFFAIPSHELAAAVRLMRLGMLVLVGVWKLPGLFIGLLLNFLLLLRTQSFGVPYLWPLIPFNGPALLHVLIRLPQPLITRRPSFTRPNDPSRR